MNNRNTAYDFSRFEPQQVPQRPGNDSNNPPKPVLLPKKKKSRQEAREESRAVAVQTLRVLSATIAIMLFVGTYIFGTLKLDEINHDIAKVQSQIKVADSENTRLKMQLNSLASLDKVEDYAINKLGMVKQEGYQVEYIDLALDDKVVLANGTTPSKKGENDGILDKLLSYFN